MHTKKSFLLHLDSLVILESMSDEQAGKFIKILYQFHVNNEIPDLDFAMTMAVTPFINQFKRDIKKYEDTCNRNKINGLKGGRKKNPLEPTRTQKTQSVKKNPLAPYNDSDSDNKNENKNDSDSNVNAQIYLDYFNLIFETKYKSLSTIKNNLEKCLEVYSMDEIKEAINKSKKSSAWIADKISSDPSLLLRQSNKAGACDYIGDILSSPEKEVKKPIVYRSNYEVY